ARALPVEARDDDGPAVERRAEDRRPDDGDARERELSVGERREARDRRRGRRRRPPPEERRERRAGPGRVAGLLVAPREEEERRARALAERDLEGARVRVEGRALREARERRLVA